MVIREIRVSTSEHPRGAGEQVFRSNASLGLEVDIMLGTKLPADLMNSSNTSFLSPRRTTHWFATATGAPDGDLGAIGLAAGILTPEFKRTGDVGGCVSGHPGSRQRIDCFELRVCPSS